MLLQIHISDGHESIYWGSVFRLLGIRSLQPLLERMGVSSELASRPEGLLRASKYFWERDWEGTGLSGYADPNFEERYRTAIETRIRSTFGIIVDHYGEDAAAELYSWAQRFLINQEERGSWSNWFLLLGPPAQLQVESQFQTEIAQFAELLEQEFGSATYEADNKALGEIDIANLSPTEYKMIELEVTRPDDFVTVDLGDLAGNVISCNHAYRFWRVLSDSLEPAEFDTWLWIGYEQAQRLGMPVEEVELPALR